MLGAFQAGAVPDVLLVPVGISYDMAPDVCFGSQVVRPSWLKGAVLGWAEGAMSQDSCVLFPACGVRITSWHRGLGAQMLRFCFLLWERVPSTGISNLGSFLHLDTCFVPGREGAL